MSPLAVFALLVVAVALWNGGNALRKRQRGHVALVDRMPRVAGGLAVAAILVLAALAVVSVSAIFIAR